MEGSFQLYTNQCSILFILADRSLTPKDVLLASPNPVPPHESTVLPCLSGVLAQLAYFSWGCAVGFFQVLSSFSTLGLFLQKKHVF